MFGFNEWKKGFDAWERATAGLMDQVLKSSAVLEPSGAALGVLFKAKVASDKAWAKWWGSVGLPTKRDQERTLHALNELESRLIDLEDKLEEMKAGE